jgi:hypothetical protein
LPTAHFKQIPNKTQSVNKEANTSYTTYKTNNAKAFWQAPQ